MMKYLILFFIYINLFANTNNTFEVVQPKQKTVFYEDFVSVVINLPKNSKANLLKIETIDNEYRHSLNIKKRDTYCKVVQLRIGENKIFISLYNNDKKLEEKTIEVFHRSEVFKEGVDIPKGFEKKYFHINKNEQSCKRCHDMSIDNITNGKKLSNINLKNTGIVNIDNISNVQIIEDTKDSKCFSCHKNVVSKKNSHAPSVNFACLQCHSGETNFFNEKFNGKSKFLAPDPIDIKCKNCHDKVDKSWYKKDSQHGPVMSGRCTKCHNPHSSDNEFFLRKPIWNLCTTCHDEKAKGKHVLNSFVFSRNKGAHPTRGRPDPVRPGRELVCSGCHNPHGSDGVYLLRTTGKTPYSVCKRCHEK